MCLFQISDTYVNGCTTNQTVKIKLSLRVVKPLWDGRIEKRLQSVLDTLRRAFATRTDDRQISAKHMLIFFMLEIISLLRIQYTKLTGIIV